MLLLKIFLSLALDNVIIMCLSVHLFEFFLLGSWGFMDVYVHVFHQIWEVLGHCLFRYCLCPFLSLHSFWNFHYLYVGLLDGISWVPYSLSTFIHSFFFMYLRLNNFHCPIFKFTDSSACSKMPLNLSSEFFISVIVLFSSSISFLFPLAFLSLY